MIFMQGLDITWGIGRVDFQQAWLSKNPSNAPRNGNTQHKNHKDPRHIINSLINSYNYYYKKLSGTGKNYAYRKYE